MGCVSVLATALEAFQRRLRVGADRLRGRILGQLAQPVAGLDLVGRRGEGHIRAVVGGERGSAPIRGVDEPEPATSLSPSMSTRTSGSPSGFSSRPVRAPSITAGSANPQLRAGW